MFLKRVFRILIYTNWLIALAAMSQCILTYYLLGLNINFYITGIETFSTLLLYNFSLLLAKPKHPENSIYERTRWVFGRMRLFYINSAICVLLLMYCLLNIQIESMVFLLLIGLFSLSYAIPIFRYNQRVIGLRNIPYFKVFHIAIIWTLSSVVLPVVELSASGLFYEKSDVYYLCIMKFVLLLICTLPFDIRDVKQDSQYGLATIATRFGVKNSKRITYSLFFIHCVLVINSSFLFTVKIGLLAANLLLLTLLLRYVFQKNANYHKVYLLDFYLIIQLLVVFTFDWILQKL